MNFLRNHDIKVLAKFFYYIVASSFLIHSASGQIVLEIKPLMPLSSLELKSLNSFSENVFVLTSGEIKFQVAAFDPTIETKSMLEDVSAGLAQAAFGHTHLLSDKEPAALLFGAPPITEEFGFNNSTFFSWFYRAGGLSLYDELWKELDLNVKGFIMQSSGPRALGWFREPFFSIGDLNGKRLRDSSDYTNSIHREIGFSVVPMKAADVIPELEKKNLDAVSWCCPSEDSMIGLQDSINNYYLQGISKNILNADLYLNKDVYKNLSSSQRKAIELAASTSIIHHSSSLIYENGKALKELVENQNVILHDTPKEYFKKYKEVAKKLLRETAQENDFFAKVRQSQKDFAILGLPFWSEVQTSDKGSND